MSLNIKYLASLLFLLAFNINYTFGCDDSGAISVTLLSEQPNGDLVFQVIIGNGEDSGDENGPNITVNGPGNIVSFSPSILCGDTGNPATGTLNGNIIDYDNGGMADWASDSYLDVVTIVIRPDDFDGEFLFELTDVNLDCDDDLVYSDSFANPNTCPVETLLGTASGWNGEEMPIPLSLAVTSAEINAITDPIFLQICSMGDIGDSDEYYEITDEDGIVITMMILENSDDDCLDDLVCETIFMNSADLSTWAGDGSIDFTVTPSEQVDDFCDNNDVTLSLLIECPVTFIPASAIPTLGQWGIIVLVLLLMIVGVQYLRSREYRVRVY